MRRFSTAIAVAAALHLASFGGPAFAARGWITGAYVTHVLVSADDRWGGCMARLSISPRSELPACWNSWVSFSCTGDFTTPIRGYRMLDQAQLALATGKKVNVGFQDDKRHNGYCFANRIDVVR